MVERWNVSLNIKNEEAHHLVQELAALTGESQTAAVTIAVRERLERIRHLREAGLADRLLAIGADTAGRLVEPYRTADHGDLLYDENGLPA
jgi:antitoxin VapB